MSNTLASLTTTQLKRAIVLKERLAGLNKELETLLGASPRGDKPVKGGMSAAGRARIAAAQRARWAKIKASQN